MKCRNCGAELNNGHCDYCGSTFSEDVKLFTLKPPQIDEDLFMSLLHSAPVLDVTCIGDEKPHFIRGI